MSVDYYSRLEQQRGPQPSESMLTAIARGLRLSLDERDHLFRLAGHHTADRMPHSDHINPAMMRILDRLTDTPAQVMTGLGETLRQTRLAVALLGNETQFTGMARSAIFRWFTDSASRCIYVETEQEMHGRVLTAMLRSAFAREEPDSRAAAIVHHLLKQSPEFTRLWNAHEIGVTHTMPKSIVHPEIGILQLNCQTLIAPDQSQALLVFTAHPGTESEDKLQRLARQCSVQQVLTSRQ